MLAALDPDTPSVKQARRAVLAHPAMDNHRVVQFLELPG